MKFEKKLGPMLGEPGEVHEVWSIEEVKTRKQIIGLMLKIAKMGELNGFGFRGYLDMDDNQNEVSFKTPEELSGGYEEIKRIDADCASVDIRTGGGDVNAMFSPFDDEGSGTSMLISGPEKEVKKVVAGIKKALG